MQRFWNTAVLPVLEAIGPESLVEIGSDHGYNTSNLLRFCHEHGVRLHVVDPLPKYDVNEWQERHGESLIFHRTVSLNAIPLINRMDAVLIDGDHNWYTVYNELKLIERRCEELSQPFPLVMLHDIGWPYGRRDLYYDPDSVPSAYRKPHARKGLRPDTPDLVEAGGLNAHLHNAMYENPLQNGVFTAVEDFIEQTEQEIEAVTLPGLHGLGILVPSHLKERGGKLEEILESLRFPPRAAQHMEQIERDRLDTLVERYEQRLQIRKLQAENQELAGWVQALESDVSALLGSRRWKFAHSLAELRQRVMLKPRVPTAVDSVNRTREQFRAWRKNGATVEDAKKKAEVAQRPNGEISESKPRRPKVSVLVWRCRRIPWAGRA